MLDDLGDDGIPQLVDAAELVAARSFNPADNRFPLETIESVGEPARESEQAFDDAAAKLEAVDDGGLVGPVSTSFTELRDDRHRRPSTLGSAYRAADLMPSLLGADGARDHLLVFENNAELRSMGGLAGSISRIHADDGEVEIVEQEGTSKYGGINRPVIPLTPGEEAVFGPTLGQWFMNASMTPDATRAAKLAAARWQQELGGDVDGVFFVDPVAVSYLLSATGPVDVPGYGSVTSTDVVAKVENEIYLTATDRAAQEDFQNAVAKAVFNAFAAGRGDPVEVIQALATAVTEGRIRMHSFVDAEQEHIDDTEIAGELETAEERGPGRDLRQRRPRVEDDLLPAVRRRRDRALVLRLRPGGRGFDPADQRGAGGARRAAVGLGHLPRRPVLRGDRARPAADRGLRDGTVRAAASTSCRSTRGRSTRSSPRTSTADRSRRSSPCSISARPRRSSSRSAPARARPARSSSTSRRGRSRGRRPRSSGAPADSRPNMRTRVSFTERERGFARTSPVV